MEKAVYLVLVRHGQSQWNKENRFTGWIDIDLCEEGIEECRKAAVELKEVRFDIGFTSQLRRGWRSLGIILEELSLTHIPIMRSAALNERHYGELQGMNKDEARQKFSADQVHRWRRGFYERPPGGESLKDTYDRAIPFFIEWILPALRAGDNVLVVAHGNSVRALVKYIENLSAEEIENFEIPTAQPLFYTFRDNKIIKMA